MCNLKKTYSAVPVLFKHFVSRGSEKVWNKNVYHKLKESVLSHKSYKLSLSYHMDIRNSVVL